MHLGGQSVCLTAGLNGSPANQSTPLAVDVILRLDYLDEDLLFLIDEINRRRDPTLPPFPMIQAGRVNVGKYMQTVNNQASDIPQTVEEAFSGPNAACVQNIANHYRRDFEQLGFSMP